MGNSEFEKLVIEKLSNIESDVWTLKSDVWTLKSDVWTLKSDVLSLNDKMDKWFNRLENLINDQTTDLEETINSQGKYINQAFSVISSMQNERARNNSGKYSAV